MNKKQDVEKIVIEKGFVLEEVKELPEMKAVFYQMHYKKNGAKLFWLKRQEENKTFAIAFKTLPSDDTGVFHILEHSLLCGSEKYPVSKPFVEMIKSSLQTFMNAFTFPDKTLYPICSRNQKDLLNLMSVYLDAVLHPLCITKEEIFRQEGWHYELEQPEGELRCNGVVYNEMKGVYASPDAIIESRLNRCLFPDNCYRFQSGGDPEHITELSYESYVANYKRFYHPSNSYMILDGDMDLEAVLTKIDEAIREFDYQDVDSEIKLQKSVALEEDQGVYAVGETEETRNKTLLAEGWVYGRYDEPKKDIACAVLTEILCSTNESPLKKALLEKGLAENVELEKIDGIQQPYLKLVIRNTEEERKEEIWNTVETTLKKLAAAGLDYKRIGAILNRMEFNMREKETAGFPEGVMNALQILNSCLYGGDPVQNLSHAALFASLRESVETGYFEQLLKEVFLDNPHHARLILRPSGTLGKEKREHERARFKSVKEQWSAEKREQVIGALCHLREVQETPDSPDKIAALPILELSDIAEEIEEIPRSIIELGNNRVLIQELDTEGIVHISYYFSLEDQNPENLSKISFLRMLLGQTDTEHYNALELQIELEERLGRFRAYVDVFSEPDDTEKCRPYLVISVSVLEEKIEEAIELIDEVLTSSKFNNLSYIRSRIRQLRVAMEQNIVMSGNRYAAQMIAAQFSARGAVQEAFEGIEMLRWVQKMDNDFEREGERLLQNLEELRRRIFVRERAFTSVTGELSQKWINKLLCFLPEGTGSMQAAVNYQTAAVNKRGIRIPAEIGFAGKGANLKICGAHYHGAMRVAARILSYGYLWNVIRVKGGAYGTGLSVSDSGDVMFLTFRDPNAANSLKSFDGAGAALRGLCESEEPLDRYVISAIASTEPLLSVRQKGIRSAEDYLSGMTDDMRRRERKEILHTTKAELVQIAGILDAICEKAGVCLIGGKASLEAVEAAFDQIEYL